MCIRAYEAWPARPYISSTSTYSLIIKQNWLILIGYHVRKMTKNWRRWSPTPVVGWMTPTNMTPCYCAIFGHSRLGGPQILF